MHIWGTHDRGLFLTMGARRTRVGEPHLNLEGAKSTVGKSLSRQKDPLMAEMAKEIADSLGPSPDLIRRRTAVTCLLGFSGFLRIKELLAIQVKHLKFEKEHLEITIPKAKNEQMREGHIVFLKRLHTPYCLVQNLQNYLQVTICQPGGEFT